MMVTFLIFPLISSACLIMVDADEGIVPVVIPVSIRQTERRRRKVL